MKHRINYFLILIIGILTSLVVVSSAQARSRFGFNLGGPVGVHASTNGGVGVSLPTPQANVGVGGNLYDVNTTVDPNGIRTNAAGPYGTAGGVNSNGDVYGGVSQGVPGGTVSGTVDSTGKASGGVTVDEIPPPTYYYGQ